MKTLETGWQQPDEVDVAELVPVYQAAFAGEPWYEVSKCADTARPRRCAGGLSRLAVGQLCSLCGDQPDQPAYDPAELMGRFAELAATRPTRWYIERVQGRVALAAVAWLASPAQVAREKYADVLAMQPWLPGALGDKLIVWLDEVFADRTVRPAGNLRRFGNMSQQAMDELAAERLAFRTINPAMTAAARRDGGATIWQRQCDVPDRRDIVAVSRKGSVR